MTTTTLPAAGAVQKTSFVIIFAVAFCHMINDVLQILVTSIYPILKANYGLDFVQIGMLAFTYQAIASLLQPVIGIYTDKHPMPYSLPVGMAASALGLIVLGLATSYPMLLTGSALIGLGSAIFHPESSRVARLASGGRHGFAQSTFQLGGNVGASLGPILAAFIVLPNGQSSVAWFALFAMGGMAVLTGVGRWYGNHVRRTASQGGASRSLPFDRQTTLLALFVLMLLTFSKNIYTASIINYFTFFLIDRFSVDVQTSQLLLFLFLAATAVGLFIGGMIGDRLGAKFVIWLSILGALPFSLLLPYADFNWTVVLTMLIGMVVSSSFPAIVVFAQELLPGRVGMVAGMFFGFAFGIGGIAAAVLGALADSQGIAAVFQYASYLPAIGLLTILLPNLKRR